MEDILGSRTVYVGSEFHFGNVAPPVNLLVHKDLEVGWGQVAMETTLPVQWNPALS